MKFSDNPYEDYVTGTPTFASSATLKNRTIEPLKRSISFTIDPDEWLNQWAKYAPNGIIYSLIFQNVSASEEVHNADATIVDVMRL